MNQDAGIILDRMKDIIDREGKGYLNREPYRVYESLLENENIEKSVAGAILLTLLAGFSEIVNNIPENKDLSAKIQDCCFLNIEISDFLASMYLSLFNEENEKYWSEKEYAGLYEFMSEDCSLHWKGKSIWEAGGGYVLCYYNADIVVKPLAECADDSTLKEMLENNPFADASAIEQHFMKELADNLDCNFEMYCSGDDYYQPVVEDFEAEYYVGEWCKLYGFDLISFEGAGEDDGYEPYR